VAPTLSGGCQTQTGARHHHAHTAETAYAAPGKTGRRARRVTLS